MTDLLTRPVEEQERQESTGPWIVSKGRMLVLALLVGVLAGWAIYSTAGPSRAELAETRWQQVVDYYSDQYQVMTDARAAAEAAHWQEVINHYARQYELMRTAQSAPATDREAAHWESVVDYYEQQWETRAR